MGTLAYQAFNVKAPELRKGQDGAGFSTPGAAVVSSAVLLYTVAATHRVDEIPEKLWGKYVKVTAHAADLHYFFSDDDTAEVDSAQAATNNGQVAQPARLGGFLATGQSEHVRVPTPPQGSKLYFVREGSGVGSARIQLTSD
jgi:hypothetical protein